MSLFTALAYAGGTTLHAPAPLDRFLPPIAAGMPTGMLAQHAAPGAWILDPFGASPQTAVELAHAGFRVLAAVNNPVMRFLFEMAARPPVRADLQAALARLAAERKGEEYLEGYLRALYQTECSRCRRKLEVEAFIWERDAQVPAACIMHCPCGQEGEQPASEADQEKARSHAAASGLHRARALERVVGRDDPNRDNAEEALACYLPRAILVLMTIINRLDGMALDPVAERALHALLLFACDEGNTLWSVPADRPRPKQLTIPARFLEKNLWLALERGLDAWTGETAVALTTWPEPPPEEGGICLYEGAVRSLAPSLQATPPQALAAVLPRPNQAFWTLSALWSGWLWGQEAVTPFRSALQRRRYDWNWHALALGTALKSLAPYVPLRAPFLAMIAEPEPAFLSAALVAASAAGFDLGGLAVRTRHDPVQVLWNRRSMSLPTEDEIDNAELQSALQAFLQARGEPAPYLHLHAAGLGALAEGHALQSMEDAPGELGSRLRAALEGSAFSHHSEGEGHETGLWGLAQSGTEALSLADQVELFLVPFLQAHPGSPFTALETALNAGLRGLLTPSLSLIREVLGSYAVESGGGWTLRVEDAPASRRAELESAARELSRLGTSLGYQVSRQEKDGRAIFWQENGTTTHAYYLLASAIAGSLLRQCRHPAGCCHLVLPGSRAGLLGAKLRRDPALTAQWEQGWRVLKFRQLRQLAAQEQIDRREWEKALRSDPLEPPEQLKMF